MEQVQGVDVSWMTHGTPKDKWNNNKPSTPRKIPEPAAPRPVSNNPATPTQIASSAPTSVTDTRKPSSPAPAAQNGSTSPGHSLSKTTSLPAHPEQANGHHQPVNRHSRSPSGEKPQRPGGASQRRGSWFSNISAKFSGSSTSPSSNQATAPSPSQQTPQQRSQSPSQPESPTASSPSADDVEPLPPKLSMGRNAVLQAGVRQEGDAPYTPAPPKSGQSGFLGVFRRLSSSNSVSLGAQARLGHGLVERKILNVDGNRERCPMPELKGSRLRRVAFSVDVEIAPMPKYTDGDVDQPAQIDKDKTTKKKWTEKGEGEALKNPVAVEEQKETAKETKVPEQPAAKEPTKDAPIAAAKKEPQTEPDPAAAVALPETKGTKEPTRKKEKKKKSEVERRARKEKKRKLAEANGTIPIEIHYSSSDSDSIDTPDSVAPAKTTVFPTTNPVRIYRRCCQLRETPILKKITEQLTDEANYSSRTGIVNRLDLTGYWLQLPDVITLGDYLAVVPVREVIMEDSGLGDEGLRVILAGLLAAKWSNVKRRKQRHGLAAQGGMVERLVLKNNKLGPDGWKHLSLFLYLCRSLKHLDVSNIPFPRQPHTNKNGECGKLPMGVANILSRCLGERLGAETLELVNLGETELSMEQLGIVMEGIKKAGVKKLGLSHNHLDETGLRHVAGYLAMGCCESLDMGGNDLREHVEVIASSVSKSKLWALSLAGCNLDPVSLKTILPVLAKIEVFRYLDLSHNRDLFNTDEDAVPIIRRYLPKMKSLKRIHIQDCDLSSEQAISIIEILPDVIGLARVNLLDNPELGKLADAKTEEAQEEAFALYASLMAATRVSQSLVCVDIEVPTDQAGEIVKALAKQVVAYCLRNMELIQDPSISAAVSLALSETQTEAHDSKPAAYPDLLVHLVGQDVMKKDQDSIEDSDGAPDESYVIGGTGVVKALTCVLKHHGNEEARRMSGKLLRETESGTASPRPDLPNISKARETSKHLLQAARKIRLRLQPALIKAKTTSGDDFTLAKFVFLDNTLEGIIKRFEDEFPDTREDAADTSLSTTNTNTTAANTSDRTSLETEDVQPVTSQTEDPYAAISDGEDESAIHPPRTLSRSNSVLFKAQAEEEGRIHRAGHHLRSSFVHQEHADILHSIDVISSDPSHSRILNELVEEAGGELMERAKDVGAAAALKESKEWFVKDLEETDPEYWKAFSEAQKKLRANVEVEKKEKEAAQADGSAVQT